MGRSCLGDRPCSHSRRQRSSSSSPSTRSWPWWPGRPWPGAAVSGSSPRGTWRRGWTPAGQRPSWLTLPENIKNMKLKASIPLLKFIYSLFISCLKCNNRFNFRKFFFKCHLARHVPDEVLRDTEFGGDVLRGDESPGDRELDVRPNVSRPLACRAVHLAPGLNNICTCMKKN